MAAGLELTADGHFHYGLAYGALDEEAAGTWQAKGDTVLLTSEPVKPPHFTLLAQSPSAGGVMRITLEVPAGVNVQYFDAKVELADGRYIGGQLSDTGLLLKIGPNDRPVRAIIALSMYELASQPIDIDATKGLDLHFRFEPNDIGKVAFDGTPLAIDNGDLLLSRYGRTLRFHKAQK